MRTNTKMTAEDRALEAFCELMTKKIESLADDASWQKPWFTNGLTWPKNVDGRPYNGTNAFMLALLCEKEQYQITRFITFARIQQMNLKDPDAPRVMILKGAKSFPVYFTSFTCVNTTTKTRISWDVYNALSNDEKQEFAVFPKTQIYNVFNVEQTNLKETRPELWAKLEMECNVIRPENNGNSFSFGAMDKMISEQAWICPIHIKTSDKAYFSISNNEIVYPEKSQFKDGESFYSNLFHEMAHSTGHESQLARVKPSSFGSAEYAREELVAEMTAALVSMKYGILKNIKSDSATYLKHWLSSMHETPLYLKSVLRDVKKASSMVIERIDKMEEHCECEQNVALVG